MQIFEQEKIDGLGDILAKSCSIAFELIPTKADINSIDLSKTFANLPDLGKTVKKVDLFYFESVLASVGWNKNDDIFDPRELWEARATPVHKKINYMHDEKDIIGHMTKALVFGHDGIQISEAVENEKIPTNFDVVVGGFLYTFWEDKALLERMTQIIDNISNKNIAVSMECIFPGFDYGIITPDGQQKVIARAEQTSFLTKHLRRYGGTGSYEGNKVGRLLRKMVFTGNAVVNKPANPRSLILRSEASEFFGSNASINIFNKKNTEISHMELSQEKYEDLLKRATAGDAAKEAYDKKSEEYNKVSKAAKDMEDECTKMKDEDKKAKADLASAQEALKKVSDELAVAKEVSKANEDKLNSANAKVTELETKLTEAKASIDKIESEKKLTSRKAALAEREIEEAKASDILNKFSNVSDELFTEVVSAFPKKAVATTNKDTFASAQMTSATATVLSDSQKALRQNVSTWFGSTLQSEKK